MVSAPRPAAPAPGGEGVREAAREFLAAEDAFRSPDDPEFSADQWDRRARAVEALRAALAAARAGREGE